MVGRFPWSSVSPRNAGNENCVFRNFQGQLVTSSCSNLRRPICSIPCGEDDILLTGDCVNDEQLMFSAFLGDFAAATAFCSSIGGAPVTFESEEDYGLIVSESTRLLGEPNGWVGLLDDGDNGDDVFTRFQFIDDSDTSFINTDFLGDFPWDIAQPSNFGPLNCVIIGSTGRLSTRDCTDTDRRAVCSVPCTLSPTLNPTTQIAEEDTDMDTEPKVGTSSPFSSPMVDSNEEESFVEAVAYAGLGLNACIVLLYIFSVFFAVRTFKRVKYLQDEAKPEKKSDIA